MKSRMVTCCCSASTCSAVLLGLLLAPGPAAAQSRITGTVTEDSTGRPVAGVEILMAGRGPVRTDTLGVYRLDGVPSGVRTALFRKIGYRPVQLRAYLNDDDTLVVHVRMAPAVLELAPIEVTASAIPPGMEAFAERRAAGFGHFIDAKVLRQSEHRRMSDLLRTVRGVSLRPVRGNEWIAISARERCPMQVYFDGVKIYEPRALASGPASRPPNLDQFNITQLEAIEVYRGPAETPAQLGGTGGACGTIVLWSRRK